VQKVTANCCRKLTTEYVKRAAIGAVFSSITSGTGRQTHSISTSQGAVCTTADWHC